MDLKGCMWELGQRREAAEHSQLGSVSLGALKKREMEFLAMVRWEKSRKEGLGQVGAGSECQTKEGEEKTKIIASLLCTRFFLVRSIA